jgi:predicted nucleic acid-binding protein
VRALVYAQPAARSWLERAASGELRLAWPSHLYAEVANAVLRLLRAGRIDRPLAEDIVVQTCRMTAFVFPIDEAAGDALAFALVQRLSVYDALYVVLAESLGAPLVTADRRLAEATEQAVLLPE